MLDLRQTAIPGVLVVATRWFSDDRGSFTETYNRQRFTAAGIANDFRQDNLAVSTKAGTLRGLHFQLPPSAQAKLVRVVKGSVFDAVVDIRDGSPTFGQWVGVELSATNRLQLMVPAGFAHGYMTLEPDTEFAYKVDAHYDKESEGGIVWNDPAIGIDWPVPASGVHVAPRDAELPTLAQLPRVANWTNEI